MFGKLLFQVYKISRREIFTFLVYLLLFEKKLFYRILFCECEKDKGSCEKMYQLPYPQFLSLVMYDCTLNYVFNYHGKPQMAILVANVYKKEGRDLFYLSSKIFQIFNIQKCFYTKLKQTKHCKKNSKPFLPEPFQRGSDRNTKNLFLTFDWTNITFIFEKHYTNSQFLLNMQYEQTDMCLFI